MIIGGVNAAGRAGCMRAGLSSSYLPMSLWVMPTKIKTAIAAGRGLQYSASARIRSVDGLSWVDLPTVTYMQVSMSQVSAEDSASIAVADAATWSPYLLDHHDLLKPSSRTVELRLGLVISGVDYKRTLFRGHVVDYTEPHGANGGSIQLRLADSREILARESSRPIAASAATTFRMFLSAVGDSIATTGSPVTSFHFRVGDSDIDSDSLASLNQAEKLRVVESVAAGLPLLQVRGSGPLVAGVDGSGFGETGDTFAYSDDNVIVATRKGGGAAFNVVRTYGKVDGVGTIGEVQDDADVLANGRRVYPPGLWGAPWLTLAVANATATEFLSASLRGKIDIEAPLNPYLRPGMRIAYQSDRLDIDGSARVYAVEHQYAVGRARTYLRDLQVVPA